MNVMVSDTNITHLLWKMRQSRSGSCFVCNISIHPVLFLLFYVFICLCLQLRVKDLYEWLLLDCLHSCIFPFISTWSWNQIYLRKLLYSINFTQKQFCFLCKLSYRHTNRPRWILFRLPWRDSKCPRKYLCHTNF